MESALKQAKILINDNLSEASEILMGVNAIIARMIDGLPDTPVTEGELRALSVNIQKSVELVDAAWEATDEIKTADFAVDNSAVDEGDEE